jgi:hypothetical protein
LDTSGKLFFSIAIYNLGIIFERTYFGERGDGRCYGAWIVFAAKKQTNLHFSQITVNSKE